MQKRTLLTSVITLLIITLPSLTMAAGSLYVVGMDETSSYDLRGSVMTELENFIFTGLEPGDTFIGRRITDQSYRDLPSNLLLPTPLSLPLINAVRNQGNNRAVIKHRKAVKQDKLLRLLAIKHLRGLTKIDPPRTDIYGFLAVCSDYFHHFKGARDKVILIASDMKDNCHRQADIDLAGARVFIIGFERDADPRKTKKLQQKWIKDLEGMNASQVVFMPAALDFKEVLKKSTNI